MHVPLPIRNRRGREGPRRQRLPQNRRARPDAQHALASGCWPTSTPPSTPSPPNRACLCSSSAAASRAGFLAGADLHGFLEIADAAEAEALSAAGPTPVRQARRAAHADVGRHPRPLSRRRSRTGPRLRLPSRPRQSQDATRLAGSESRPPSRLGRHATVAARRRTAASAGNDPRRQTAWSARGAALGLGRRGADE